MEELLRLPELIEILWNVNSIDVVIDNIRDIELIETLWNVNLFMRFSRWTTYDELIETLWNVNLNIVPFPFVNKSN